MDDPCKSGMVALRSDHKDHGITCVAPFARVRRTNCEAAYQTSMASVLCSPSSSPSPHKPRTAATDGLTFTPREVEECDIMRSDNNEWLWEEEDQRTAQGESTQICRVLRMADSTYTHVLDLPVGRVILTCMAQACNTRREQTEHNNNTAILINHRCQRVSIFCSRDVGKPFARCLFSRPALMQQGKAPERIPAPPSSHHASMIGFCLPR